MLASLNLCTKTKHRSPLFPRFVCVAGLAFSVILFPSFVDAKTVAVTVGPGGAHAFSPQDVSVDVGDTVEWTWDSNTHSVTSGDPDTGTPDGLFDSEIQNQPFTFSYTFTSPGTFEYYCIPHRALGMIGSVTVTGGTPTPTPTPTPTVTPTPTPTPTPPAQSLNVSTRLDVGTGDKVSIGGIIITEGESKRVLLRAIGPSLANFGITDPLPDPILELHAGDGSLITSNDNWEDSPQAPDIEATTLAPTNPLESAIIATLDPGLYTAIVNGKDGGTGVGLVEAYDLDQSATSQLGNLSTRGFVDIGNNVMIGGFILGPDEALDANILVRAIGPSLTDFGVTGALADPILELHDANGTLLKSNDNWKDSQETAIEATGLQPTNDLESAILMTLSPGGYTAVVSGGGGSTGVALVEIYRLP